MSLGSAGGRESWEYVSALAFLVLGHSVSMLLLEAIFLCDKL